MNPSPSSSSFHYLPSDCIHLILHYHIIPLHDISAQGEPFSSGSMNESNHREKDWNFLKAYAHSCELIGLNTMEFVDKCRDGKIKPSFYYLYIMPMPGDRLVSLDAIRGVQKLELALCDLSQLPDADKNFRGIQSLLLNQCTLHPNNHLLENLRGIKELRMENCESVSLSAEDFQNLRGIRKLDIFQSELALTEQHLQNLRGIEELQYSTEITPGHTPLTDASLLNLRGVQVLRLNGEEFVEITNAGLAHLNNLKDLSICDLPRVNCSVLKHLRGIECLSFFECRNIEFEPNSLRYLRGSIKTLNWYDDEDAIQKRIDGDHMQHLQGVEELQLDGVTFISDDAFQYLCEVCKLILEADGDGETAMSQAHLSHLRKVKELTLRDFNLDQVKSFSSSSLLSLMPEFELFVVEKCFVSEDAVETVLGKVYSNHDDYFVFFTLRRVDGELVHCS